MEEEIEESLKIDNLYCLLTNNRNKTIDEMKEIYDFCFSASEFLKIIQGGKLRNEEKLLRITCEGSQWKLACKCLKLFNLIIQQFDQSSFELLNFKKTVNLILHLISMLTDVSISSGFSEMDSCLLQCLIFVEYSIQLNKGTNQIDSNMPILPDIIKILIAYDRISNRLINIRNLVSVINSYS